MEENTNSKDKDATNGVPFDINQLIGPLTSALVPQIKHLINSEFEKQKISHESHVRSENIGVDGRVGPSKNVVLNTTEMNKNIQKEAEDSFSSNLSNVNEDRSRKRKYVTIGDDETPDDGELHSEDDDIQILDPLDVYSQSVKPWSAPEATTKYLKSYMRRSLNNDERKSILENFPLPLGPEVMSPRVDATYLQLLKRKGISLK